jgi:hypothetical protein
MRSVTLREPRGGGTSDADVVAATKQRLAVSLLISLATDLHAITFSRNVLSRGYKLVQSFRRSNLGRDTH